MHTMRRKGLALPKTDPAYGMPVGNDLDDTAGTSITCGTTYLLRTIMIATYPHSSGKKPQVDINIPRSRYIIGEM